MRYRLVAGPGIIDHDIQVVAHQVRALEAVTEREVPCEAGGRSTGQARRRCGWARARPVQIRLHIVKGADARRRGPGNRVASTKTELSIERSQGTRSAA